MRSFRPQKIASVIEHELGKLLARDFYVPGSLVTVLGVDVSADRLHATVKVGIIPYEKGPEVFHALGRVRGSYERQLLRTMQIRPFPHLMFAIAEPEKQE